MKRTRSHHLGLRLAALATVAAAAVATAGCHSYSHGYHHGYPSVRHDAPG